MRNQTYALERFTFQIHSVSASTTRDPRYVLCTGKELVPRGEQWSVPPWGQGTRHRTRAHDSQDRKMPSAGGTIAVLPRLPCPSSISYIVAPPSLRVA